MTSPSGQKAEADSAPILAHPFRAILFDLDGTLVDTATEIALALARTFAELGLAALAPHRVRDLIGRGVPSLVERALAQAGAVGVDVPQAVVRFEVHYAGTIATAAELFPGVREGVDFLHGHGVPMGVVTNKPRYFTDRLLDRFGLGERLAVVVAGDDGYRRKPEGDMLEAACARLGVPPRQALMVGDSATTWSPRAVPAARCGACRMATTKEGRRKRWPATASLQACSWPRGLRPAL